MPRSIILSLLVLLLATASIAPVTAAPCSATTPIIVDEYYRTELYFGRSRPDGGEVSDEEWTRFLEMVITPRFPDGFTILDGKGQYREKNGKIDVERSEVLVFLYTKKARGSASRKINEIRKAYVKEFAQESVMRVDLRSTVNVSF